MVDFLLPLLAAFLVALFATPVVIKIAGSLGIVDNPLKRPHPATLHTIPIPRGGGIPVFLGLLTSLLFLPINPKLSGIVAGAAIILAVGIADDRKNIHPATRLLINFIAAGVVVASGINITFITNPLGGIIDLTSPWFISSLLTIVWIVALTNMVSWSSGVDGQLAGFVPIAAATIGALSLRFATDITAWPIVVLSLVIAGSYLGLLFFSVYPQRIMPGYSGGALAGYLLATLAIVSGAKLATLVIVLGIPVMDALFSIMRRLLQGKSPIWGDTGHLHHRLLALGWTKPQVAGFYWGLAAVLGFLVLHLNSQAKLYTIVMLGVLVGALILWLAKFRRLFSRPA